MKVLGFRRRRRRNGKKDRARVSVLKDFGVVPSPRKDDEFTYSEFEELVNSLRSNYPGDSGLEYYIKGIGDSYEFVPPSPKEHMNEDQDEDVAPEPKRAGTIRKRKNEKKLSREGEKRKRRKKSKGKGKVEDDTSGN